MKKWGPELSYDPGEVRFSSEGYQGTHRRLPAVWQVSLYIGGHLCSSLAECVGTLSVSRLGELEPRLIGWLGVYSQ